MSLRSPATCYLAKEDVNGMVAINSLIRWEHMLPIWSYLRDDEASRIGHNLLQWTAYYHSLVVINIGWERRKNLNTAINPSPKSNSDNRLTVT